MGAQNSITGPVIGPSVRTASRLTSNSMSTAVSANTRGGAVPCPTARCQASSISSGPATTCRWPAAPAGFSSNGNPAWTATSLSSPTDPTNQNGAVGKPSSSAASRRKPSRSVVSRTLRALGTSSVNSSSVPAKTASMASTAASVASEMLSVTVTTKSGSSLANSADTPGGSASATSSLTAVTSAPRCRKAVVSSRLSSPEPSSITRGPVGSLMAGRAATAPSGRCPRPTPSRSGRPIRRTRTPCGPRSW